MWMAQYCASHSELQLYCTGKQTETFFFIYLFWGNSSTMSRKPKVELSIKCTDNRLMRKREQAVIVVRDVFLRRVRENVWKVVGERWAFWWALYQRWGGWCNWYSLCVLARIDPLLGMRGAAYGPLSKGLAHLYATDSLCRIPKDMQACAGCQKPQA